MAAYLINSYDIEDLESFKNYPPKVAPLLAKYGARVLSSDVNGITFEGKSKSMNAIIEFPSEEAARNCYNDPDYQEVKKIRISSTSNCSMILVREFKSPNAMFVPSPD